MVRPLIFFTLACPLYVVILIATGLNWISYMTVRSARDAENWMFTKFFPG